MCLWERITSINQTLIYFNIMRGAGRFLQFIALFLLPLAVLLELSGALGRSGGLADMLKLMVVGILAFVLGRLLEGYARSPNDE